MKKIIVLLLISLLCFCGCSVYSSNSGKLITINNSIGMEGIANSVGPAIVGVSGIKSGGNSVGSGVCVSKGGYVLTNSHVINNCDEIQLYLHEGSIVDAEVIYEDTVMDLAILRSEVSLPYLQLGDSDDLTVGQDVLAVGTPLSLMLVHTYTKGIVSAINRTIKVGSNNGEGYMQNMIQHDASLNPGNSGGPLINSKGEVVGINTLKISSGEGIGFAIPSKSFRSLLNSYSSRLNYNKPYLGVYGYDCEIAKFRGQSNHKNGFYVIDVHDNSPLALAGLKPSDIITEINAKPIMNSLDLRDQLYSLNRGDSVSVKFVSQGKQYSVRIKV